MKDRNKKVQLRTKKLWFVGIFAVALAYLEAAVVVYLRRVYHINSFTDAVPAFEPHIASVEIGREVETLVLLWAVGWLAGKRLQSRLGFSIFAFGVWDIFYYAWLKVFIGWPAAFMDMDLLFLIPLQWWGPVLAPILIAVLLAVGGAWAVHLEGRGVKVRLSRRQLLALLCGLAIVLYTFMADALALLPADAQALSHMIPSDFKWPVFLFGYILLVFSAWQAVAEAG